MLLANQARGTDSTGVAAINYDGKYDILKTAQAAAKFIDREDSTRLLRTDAPLMIGHTRMTSMGNDVRDENAHPFVEGNVIGAHNGIINNYMQLDRTVRVDSQAVFRELDNNPDALDYVFSRVSGSAALTWWDARDAGALYLVAHQNPLSVAIVPRIKTVYWSSVLDHLQSAMRVAYGKDVEYVTVKPDTVYRINAEDVYEWNEAKVSFQGQHYSRGINYDGWMLADEYEEWTGNRLPAPYVSPKALTPTALPATESPEEEARYQATWERMMGLRDDDSPSENDDDSEGTIVATRGIHDIPNPENIDIDLIDVQDCSYCDKPLGKGGVWDSGLAMMLCRQCQDWWDKYGHYMTKDKAPSYVGPQS